MLMGHLWRMSSQKDLTTSYSSIYKKNDDLLKLQNDTWSYCLGKYPIPKTRCSKQY